MEGDTFESSFSRLFEKKHDLPDFKSRCCSALMMVKKITISGIYCPFFQGCFLKKLFTSFFFLTTALLVNKLPKNARAARSLD